MRKEGPNTLGARMAKFQYDLPGLVSFLVPILTFDTLAAYLCSCFYRFFLLSSIIHLVLHTTNSPTLDLYLLLIKTSFVVLNRSPSAGKFMGMSFVYILPIKIYNAEDQIL